MADVQTSRVLVIDDEEVLREGCRRALSGPGISVLGVGSGEAGINRLQREPFDIVILDLLMPGMDGFEVLRWIRANQPELQVVVATGFATVDRAVTAIKEGAFDFVGKPFTPEYLRLVVQRAIAQRALVAEANRLRAEKAEDLYTIAEERSRLSAVFRCMEGAVLVTNREGVVVLHNPAAIRLLELQTDPVVGKPLADSVRCAELVDMVSEVARSFLATSREFPPGSVSRHFLKARSAPVRTPAGKLFGCITVFEDISTHKAIEQQKAELLSMVAHELRSPLASIKQMLFALRPVEDPERRRHLQDRMEARIGGLLELIENLLQLSRLEAGVVTLSLHPESVGEMLEDVIEGLRPQAAAKTLELQLQGGPAPARILADRDRLRIAFVNLVDNAIKYTPEGGRVTVRVTPRGSVVTVDIEDTGIGIDPAEQERVFDRFYRVVGAATRGIPGSGFGLSLAKRIVEEHRGFIDLRSEQGVGSTFTVTLPLME